MAEYNSNSESYKKTVESFLTLIGQARDQLQRPVVMEYGDKYKDAKIKMNAILRFLYNFQEIFEKEKLHFSLEVLIDWDASLTQFCENLANFPLDQQMPLISYINNFYDDAKSFSKVMGIDFNHLGADENENFDDNYKYDVIRKNLNSMGSRLSVMEASLNAQEGRVKFAEEKFLKDFSSFYNEKSLLLSNDIKLLMGRYDSDVLGKMAEVEEKYNQANSLDEKTKKLLEAMGVVASTTYYGKIAKRESKNGASWRRLTIYLFCVAILVSTLTAFLSKKFDVAYLVHLLPAFLFVSFTIYASRQASMHLKSAEKARQTQAELASFEPFILELEKSTQDKVREKVSEKYFPISNRHVEPKKDKDDAAKDIKLDAKVDKLLDAVIDVVKKKLE